MTIPLSPYALGEKNKYNNVKRFLACPKRSSGAGDKFNSSANLIGDDISILSAWNTPKINKEYFYQILIDSKLRSILRGNLTPRFYTLANWLRQTEELTNKPSDIVHFDSEESVDSLLGTAGKIVLNKVINLIQLEAEEQKWPLRGLEIQYKKDAEIENWEYILILLDFNSSFDYADKYLTSLYVSIDNLTERLSPNEKDILAKYIYIDFKT